MLLVVVDEGLRAVSADLAVAQALFRALREVYPQMMGFVAVTTHEIPAKWSLASIRRQGDKR